MNNQNKNGIIFEILYYAKDNFSPCSFAQFWGVMHQNKKGPANGPDFKLIYGV